MLVLSVSWGLVSCKFFGQSHADLGSSIRLVCVVRGRGTKEGYLNLSRGLTTQLFSFYDFNQKSFSRHKLFDSFPIFITLDTTSLWTLYKCCLKLSTRWKKLPQIGHISLFSPWWKVRCRVKCCWRPKVFPQILQGYFTPRWMSMWALNLEAVP